MQQASGYGSDGHAAGYASEQKWRLGEQVLQVGGLHYL
jgi:hypothetical protein